MTDTRLWQVATAVVLAAILSLGTPAAFTQAATERSDKDEPGLASRIEYTVEKVLRKIEEGFRKAADKLEAKRVGEKVEQKLDKAAKKTGEGFEKAGKKIEQKLGD